MVPGVTVEHSSEGLTTTQLAVSGMHCGSCAALVEEILTDHAGVASAAVTLEPPRATVRFDPALVDPQALASLIAEAGYKPTFLED